MRQTVEDISRLPKWAQTKIRVLEMRLEESAARIRQIDGLEETNVFMDGGMGEDRRLPKDTRILFKLPGRMSSLYCRIDKGRLYVQSAGASVRIAPASANSFHVEVQG
jgi:hypothetical protein